MDVNLFKENRTNCNLESTDNIVNECQHLKRLAFALRYFNDNKNNKKQWNEFCLHMYGYKLLDDYQHLLSVHSNEFNEIKKELIKTYGFSSCLINECVFSIRHFNEVNRDKRNDEKQNNSNDAHVMTFYEQEYDSLHFNLFHLFEIGYRFKKDANDQKDNNEDSNDNYMNCIDNEFIQMTKKNQLLSQ
eukprot:112344_1